MKARWWEEDTLLKEVVDGQDSEQADAGQSAEASSQSLKPMEEMSDIICYRWPLEVCIAYVACGVWHAVAFTFMWRVLSMLLLPLWGFHIPATSISSSIAQPCFRFLVLVCY